MNSVVYGGLFETAIYKNFKRRVKSLFCENRYHTGLNGCSADSLLKNSAGGMSSVQSRAGPNINWSSREQRKLKPVSLFVSTYNLAEKTLPELGDLSPWVPSGHDLYAIGVQECMCLGALRRQLLDMLGGDSKYTMFVAEIGSTNTALGFHGMIAVTVFAKTEDVKSGAFYMSDSNELEVKKGVSLGVTTAPNKGAVGLPFIYHDTSLAFFTGHYAANSKGRNRLKARINDSRDTMSKSVLTADDIHFDSHLTHDYVFVFGDLNFRCVSSPDNVLNLVSQAAVLERNLLHKGSKDWLLESYDELKAGRDQQTAKKLSASASAMSTVSTAWSKVLALDELNLVMNQNKIFFNFKEAGAPFFPPSFRRKCGVEGDCGDYTDMAKVANAYTTRKEESAAIGEKGTGEDEDVSSTRNAVVDASIGVKLKLGERIPSYTDRILYHCLPDKVGQLVPGPYRICDSLLGSDHRPVSGSFQILVNSNVRQGKKDNSKRLSAESYQANAGSGINGGDEGDLGSPGYDPTGGSRSSSSNRSLLRVVLKNTSLMLLDTSVNSTDQDFSQPPTSSSDNYNYNYNSPRRPTLCPASETAEEVVMVFPLPTEDPLVEERRIHALAFSMGGLGGQDKVLLQNRSAGETVIIEGHDLMAHETRVAWKHSSSNKTGARILSETSPELGVHVLIKVNGRNGTCLGQGVLGLGSLLDKVLVEGETAGKQVELDLTLGGELVGRLGGAIEITEFFKMVADGAGAAGETMV